LEPGKTVLFEEFNAEPARYYVLTLLRGSATLEIARKIWFDRTDLSITRVQLYGPGGRLVSEIRYADWQPAADVRYPRHIWLERGKTVLFEEFNAEPARYYVLTLLRGSATLEIARKIWFDRTDLSITRVQLYGPGGRLVSEIRYADWQPAADVRYPRHIWLER